MSREDIIQILMGHVGKAVRIVYASGDLERVSVVNVDGEGFVADREEHGEMVPRWTRFEDVESVLPSAGGLKYLPNCEERDRLRSSYNAARADHAAAIDQANAARGKVSKVEYDRLRTLVDDAKAVRDTSRVTLEKHKTGLGC